jgi:RNA polymerase sigma factor for flagellar operon FliA
MTMREVGLTLNVVESRVSQIHSSAMVRLRAALRVSRSPGKRIAASRKAPARTASTMPR